MDFRVSRKDGKKKDQSEKERESHSDICLIGTNEQAEFSEIQLKKGRQNLTRSIYRGATEPKVDGYSRGLV